LIHRAPEENKREYIEVGSTVLDWTQINTNSFCK